VFNLVLLSKALDNAELFANLRRGSVVVARDLQVSSTADGQYEVCLFVCVRFFNVMRGENDIMSGKKKS
jgi:hypothetical protein